MTYLVQSSAGLFSDIPESTTTNLGYSILLVPGVGSPMHRICTVDVDTKISDAVDPEFPFFFCFFGSWSEISVQRFSYLRHFESGSGVPMT